MGGATSAERVNTPEVLSYLGLTLSNAASLATDQGDHDVAAALYQECLEIHIGLANRINPPEALRELARTVSGAGHLCDKLGRTAVASSRTSRCRRARRWPPRRNCSARRCGSRGSPRLRHFRRRQGVDNAPPHQIIPMPVPSPSDRRVIVSHASEALACSPSTEDGSGSR